MEKPAVTDYAIHELLSRRWSPRAFGSKSVDQATLASLLEAARWAPSCFNEQPWAFIVGTSESPADHAKVLQCMIEFNQSWAKAAPVVMLTVAHNLFEKNGKANRHAFHDVGLAMGNLTVQATSMGLEVHQMGGIVPEKAKELFAIPEGWEAVTGVAIGYPGDPATLSDQLRERELEPRTRKPQSAFVFGGKWGQAIGG